MLLAAVVDYRVSACRNCLRKHKCIHVDNVLVCVCMCFDVKQSGGVVKKLGWSELSSRWYFSCLVITLTNEKVNVSIRKRGPREVETAKKNKNKKRNKTLVQVQVKARKPDITQVNQGRLLFHSISFLCQSMKTKMDRRTRREQTEEEREKLKREKIENGERERKIKDNDLSSLYPSSLQLKNRTCQSHDCVLDKSNDHQLCSRTFSIFKNPPKQTPFPSPEKKTTRSVWRILVAARV